MSMIMLIMTKSDHQHQADALHDGEVLVLRGLHEIGAEPVEAERRLDDRRSAIRLAIVMPTTVVIGMAALRST